MGTTCVMNGDVLTARQSQIWDGGNAKPALRAMTSALDLLGEFTGKVGLLESQVARLEGVKSSANSACDVHDLMNGLARLRGARIAMTLDSIIDTMNALSSTAVAVSKLGIAEFNDRYAKIVKYATTEFTVLRDIIAIEDKTTDGKWKCIQKVSVAAIQAILLAKILASVVIPGMIISMLSLASFGASMKIAEQADNAVATEIARLRALETQ